jgi:2-polyprenyl-6-methoxyphenol hydroxylase-like FAD-dependent oxidoreductase
MFLFVFRDERLSEPAPCDAKERKETLRRVFGDIGWECPEILLEMDSVEDIYFDRVSQIRMNSWSKGRVVLLGDAASCASLLAGEGAGLAMVEAYVLAGELNRANGEYQAAFRRYEERLRPFIEAKQRSAYKSASVFAPRTQVGLSIRNFISRLLGIPAIANYFVGRLLQDDFELPNYEMSSPASSHLAAS